MRTTLDFRLNGGAVSLGEEDPARTLLTWLRERRGLVGTKEGCAEGDCGACTVVVADLGPAGNLRYQPVNSCILCLGALDGREVITVEALKSHPVQRAMVDCHGSQCGFCTPGFVMALYAHLKSRDGADPRDAIAGNLCRCTGYRPILEAGERARSLVDAKAERAEDEARRKRLGGLPGDSVLAKNFFVPATVAEVLLSGRVARTGIFRRFTAADRAAAERALDTVGMSELARASVAELSGGQQQRTLIGRALAAEPDVLVLDEPVAGVDLEHQESFAVTLGELKREGRSVLLVAHALGVMEPLVDRSVVLQGGRITYDGPPLAQQIQPAHAHHHPRERHRDHFGEGDV